MELYQQAPCVLSRLCQENLAFLGAFGELRTVTINFVKSLFPSVRPSTWNNSAPTGRIFMKFDI
jgi:hypothetical protein